MHLQPYMHIMSIVQTKLFTSVNKRQTRYVDQCVYSFVFSLDMYKKKQGVK